jgi:hypothetical protein
VTSMALIHRANEDRKTRAGFAKALIQKQALSYSPGEGESSGMSFIVDMWGSPPLLRGISANHMQDLHCPGGATVLGGFLGREQMRADLKTDADLAVELEECTERSLACAEKVFALEKPYDEAEEALNKAEKALGKARERFERVQKSYGEADERYEEAKAVLKRVIEEVAAAGLLRVWFTGPKGKCYEVTEKGSAYLQEDASYH